MKNIQLFSLISLLTLSNQGCIENVMSQKAKLPNNYHYLKVKASDAIISININGAPIISSNDTDGIIAIEPINSWLIENKNTLSFVIHPPKNYDDTYSPKLTATVFLHDNESETPSPKKQLAILEYEHHENDNFPKNVTITFNFDGNISTKLWNENLEIQSLSNSDKSEIINLVASLENSIVENQIDTAIELQKYKINDDALAEGKTVQQLVVATKNSYKWLNTQKGLVSKSITLDDIKFNICCNNKLVYLTRINNEEAILLESDELFFDIAIFVAKIRGKWTIVR